MNDGDRLLAERRGQVFLRHRPRPLRLREIEVNKDTSVPQLYEPNMKLALMRLLPPTPETHWEN